ncbi:uncharacterized protein SAPINGB_P000758 [Magnusiomyces paraingens]|uniref:XPG-I domain-containing protein n=1 Tax=Magnusiomyces paraingens TaxID=2606893 RepID=A0A5E8B9H9_9ASCO|nr:uncharacterized protein SAPINGB_P000758 [Saprochaete ingens]VVT45462.1 unnamed protein product [Saprochaete ingens]
MTLRPLDAWITERRIVRTLNLSTLKGSKIGIYANNYIDSIVRSNSEPLVQALGGVPFSLLDHVAADLAAFQANGITPLFVFDGLSVNSQRPVTTDSSKRETTYTPFASSSNSIVSEISSTLHKRNQAWDDYEKGQAEQAVRDFEQVTDLCFDAKKQFGVRTLFNFFNQREPSVEFVVAPYTASAQLIYFQSEGYIDAIYGSYDVMLYAQTDRLITNIDSRGNGGHGNFSWISKRMFIYDLGISHEQFVEACIISGSVGFAPYSNLLYPPISQQLLSSVPGGPAAASAAIASAGSAVAAGLYAASAPFKLALDYVSTGPISIFPTIAAYSDQQEAALSANKEKYVIKFQKAYATILYQPVLKENGKVEPIPSEDEWPSDIHEFVGQRLPDEIYFYLSKGLVGPEILNALTSGYLFEPAPLDGGRQLSYRKFVTNIHNEVQSKSINFLAQILHRYFQHRPIKNVVWYDLSQDQVVRKIPTSLLHQTQGWKVTREITEGKYASQKTLKYKSQLAKLICPFFLIDDDSEEELQAFITATVFKKKYVPSITPVSTPPLPSSTASPASGTPTTAPATTASPAPSTGAPPVTTYPSPVPPVYSTVEELVSNSIWRVLQAIGLFNNEHNLTPWGKVIAKTLNLLETNERFKDHAQSLAEPLTLALLLIRDGFLNATKTEPEYTGGPDSHAPADIQAHVLLLSRVASFVSLRHNPVGFAGPLSRTILAFNSTITREYSAYRQLVEAALVAILATGEVDRFKLTSAKYPAEDGNTEPSTKVWGSISSYLPFSLAPNCGAGVAMKLYLDRATGSTTTTAATASTTKAADEKPNTSDSSTSTATVNSTSGPFVKVATLDDLRGMFKQAVDVEGDLSVAFVLWKVLYQGVLDAEANGLLSTSASRPFHLANTWIEPFVL